MTHPKLTQSTKVDADRVDTWSLGGKRAVVDEWCVSEVVAD